MPFQVIGVILTSIGLFGDVPILFFIGGFMCLAMDIIGFMSGKLKPVFPIILYIAGYAYVGNWKGILLGSAAGNLIDVIPLLLSSSFLSSKKEDKKRIE